VKSPAHKGILLHAGLLAWLAASSPAEAQRGPVVIAILPFEDRGSYGQDKEIFRALQLGIPATIASELSGHSELRLADRNRVAQALQAENLGPNARLDATSAARVGHQVGARYAVTGNFSDFYGKIRLDARIVDAESGQIVKVVSNKDPRLQDRANLYRIIQTVGHQVLSEASPSFQPGALEAGSPPVPTEALTQFSLGLLSESRGEKNKAAEYYQRAVAAFPDYSDAKEGLRRTRTS
jgi:TolB-like protein